MKMSRYYELESGNTKSLVDIIIDLEDAVGEANLNRDIAENLALEIGEERDMLAYENKNMADFIKYNNKTITNSDVGDIATSTYDFDIWDRFLSKHNNYESHQAETEQEQNTLDDLSYILADNMTSNSVHSMLIEVYDLLHTLLNKENNND